MKPIYLKSERHGTTIVYTEDDAKRLESAGWLRVDGAEKRPVLHLNKKARRDNGNGREHH